MTDDELSDVLATALLAGRILLENGASTARVEETVVRLGLALGAEQVEVFATPTGLFATNGMGGEHRTRIERITRADMDLSKIEAVLAISRAAATGRLDRQAVRSELTRAAAMPRPFGLALTPFASGVACLCSAALLGAGWREIGATAVAAALGHLVAELLGRVGLGRIMGTVIAAATAAGVALALAVGAAQPAVAMSSAILMLTPGVLIVSSISDLFRGDTIAGMARAAMALLTVAAIAAGVWLVLALSGASLTLVGLSEPGWLESFGLAAVTTLGFAALFGVPVRRTLPCAVAGVLGYAANRLGLALGAPPGVAIFLGGLAVGLAAEALARLLRAPATLFAIPGIITLVPGGIAFRTMLAFAQGDVPAGTADLVLTALLAGALAAGLGVVTALAGVSRQSDRVTR